MQMPRIDRVDLTDDNASVDSLVALHVASALDVASPASELRHYAGLDPGYLAVLARLDGDPVGAATLGRCFMYEEAFDGGWATLVVAEAERRQGIGGALYRTVSEVARARGWSTLVTAIPENRPEAAAWLTRRGFRETERSRQVELVLTGMAPPPIAPPSDVEIITLADRPQLADALHGVAIEAYPDIPHRTEPAAAGDLAEFRAHEIDHPGVPHDGVFIALAAGAPVAYATMLILELEPDTACHGMTAVTREWRGRGVATALKRACIGWGIERGLRRLLTENDLANAPMRAVNARLGYTPLPERLLMRGPLAPNV